MEQHIFVALFPIGQVDLPVVVMDHLPASFPLWVLFMLQNRWFRLHPLPPVEEEEQCQWNLNDWPKSPLQMTQLLA